jgi:hypothetical protein
MAVLLGACPVSLPTRGGHDTVDRIVAAWRRRDPHIDSSSLEITGRLVLTEAVSGAVGDWLTSSRLAAYK